MSHFSLVPVTGAFRRPRPLRHRGRGSLPQVIKPAVGEKKDWKIEKKWLTSKTRQLKSAPRTRTARLFSRAFTIYTAGGDGRPYRQSRDVEGFFFWMFEEV